MVMNQRVFLFILVFFVSLSFVSAWNFTGVVYDINDKPLYNATINITVKDQTFTTIGYNSTFTNSTGGFNMSVSDNAAWMYQIGIKHYINNKTDSSTALDYMGQSLPAFPYMELSNGMNINFYLKEGGTINITALNRTNGRANFNYIIKDTNLGYPIAESFTTVVSQAVINVPRDRNYSIMVYPQNSMPVSYNWDNFTATIGYNFTIANLSSYDNNFYTVHKQFNLTETLVNVGGYTNLSDIVGWDEFRVIPFLLEPGNMIYLGDGTTIPFDMGAWNATPYYDQYGLGSMAYNITLPGPAEGASYILFATARNGTRYYGGYRNITLSYGDSNLNNFNFTMYPLMSSDWASSNSNLSVTNASSWSSMNISSAQQVFNLINASGSILTGTSAHIESTVDYSNYGAVQFTFMLDTKQESSASFYLPLINETGVKEMNIYTMSYASKRVPTKTQSFIINNSNITMNTFNPGDIDGNTASASINIAIYKSNSTCDLPGNEVSCALTTSSNMDTFNPLSTIMGGGKISFRMGIGGVLVHYVNVDMIASGPPDALFDSNDDVTEGTSDGFAKALRFGSSGPTIYDYVLVSIPYTEGTTSTTGLNENGDVNISIPVLYDDNWNVIWNSTANGTSGAALAANDSHYNTYQTEWQTLMSQTNCTKTSSTTTFNITNPCYIDMTNNRIWIRLPHFSGTGPSVSGSVVTATSTTTTSSGGTSSSNAAIGGSELPGEPEGSNEGPDIDLSSEDVNIVQVGASQGQILSLTFGTVEHSVTIQEITENSVTLIIESDPIEVTLLIGETKEIDVDGNSINDLAITLNDIDDSIVDLTFERLVSVSEIEESEELLVEQEEKKGFNYWWVILIFVVVVVIVWYFKKK